jgi:hypothetical protein
MMGAVTRDLEHRLPQCGHLRRAPEAPAEKMSPGKRHLGFKSVGLQPIEKSANIIIIRANPSIEVFQRG